MKKIVVMSLFFILISKFISADDSKIKWDDDGECREIVIKGCVSKYEICPKIIRGWEKLEGNTFNLVAISIPNKMSEKQRLKEIDCQFWAREFLYTDMRGYKRGSFIN